MALGLCKICCDIAKNLYKKPSIPLYQKIVSCKFIHNSRLRSDDAGDVRKVESKTVIKLSRPNINPFEDNTESTEITSTSPSAYNNYYNANKHYRRTIELHSTPFQRYWSCNPQHKDNSIVRYYSSKKNTNRCKKENEKCRKMVAPCCDPPARKSCRPPVDNSTCCKQEAPYPSYSEKCVEELINKPSECKLCPWTPDKHPYFEYVDEFPHFKHPKKPKKHVNECRKQKYSTQASTAGESTFKNDSSGSLLAINEDEIVSVCSNIRFDKKPCKPPPPKCKPEPPKCDKGKKEEAKPKKKKQDDCKKKCSDKNDEEEYWLKFLSDVELDLGSKNKNECVKKSKIRKFPFPNPPPIKNVDADMPCPKPKIKSPIKDCPTGGGCNQCLPNTNTTTPEPEPTLGLHTVIINSDQSTDANRDKFVPMLFEEGAISLNGTLRHPLYLEDDKDNKCPPDIEKSKVCPKESLILPKRRKVKRPPLCSEKEGNKKK